MRIYHEVVYGVLEEIYSGKHYDTEVCASQEERYNAFNFITTCEVESACLGKHITQQTNQS